jgi:hypothetical protein
MIFQSLLEKLANALNFFKIPYMIIGGQAVLLYGEPRLTDVKTILLKNPEYNETYIFQWLSQFDQALHIDFTGIFESVKQG